MAIERTPPQNMDTERSVLSTKPTAHAGLAFDPLSLTQSSQTSFPFTNIFNAIHPCTIHRTTLFCLPHNAPKSSKHPEKKRLPSNVGKTPLVFDPFFLAPRKYPSRGACISTTGGRSLHTLRNNNERDKSTRPNATTLSRKETNPRSRRREKRLRKRPSPMATYPRKARAVTPAISPWRARPDSNLESQRKF